MSEKGDGPQKNNPDSFNARKVGIGIIHTSGDTINRNKGESGKKSLDELAREHQKKKKHMDNIVEVDFGSENSSEKTEG